MAVAADITLADKLEQLRLKRGLSVDELAARAELPTAALYLYLRGKSVPGLAVLQRLCRELAVDLGTFGDVVLPEDHRRRPARMKA